MGVQIAKESGNFGSVRPSEKHCESLLRCMQQKINNGSRLHYSQLDGVSLTFLM